MALLSALGRTRPPETGSGRRWDTGGWQRERYLSHSLRFHWPTRPACLLPFSYLWLQRRRIWGTEWTSARSLQTAPCRRLPASQTSEQVLLPSRCSASTLWLPVQRELEHFKLTQHSQRSSNPEWTHCLCDLHKHGRCCKVAWDDAFMLCWTTNLCLKLRRHVSHAESKENEL